MFPRSLRWFGGACLTMVLWAGVATADDWPTYNHDPSRSAATSEELSLPLALRWAHEPAQPPLPAWPEPGKELHRMDFDYAPQPVICEGLVYVASSADDTLRALQLASGELAWQFTANAAIRFAPSIARGKLYVAADDGWVYCLQAKTGALVWQFRAAGGDDQLIGNGRMMSRWPCRCGALVVDGVVYCTAGMWPSEGVYVYALDADSGKTLWCNDSSGDVYLHTPHPGATSFSGVAPQGYLLVSGDTLLVPTGRCVPAAFDRHTGRLLYYKPAEALYQGGAWLTASEQWYFNPKNRFQNPSTAFVGEAQPVAGDGMLAYAFASGDPQFTLAGAYRVLASGGMVYAVTTEHIQAMDLGKLGDKQTDAALPETGKKKKGIGADKAPWTTPHTQRVYCLALAGKTLFCGQRDGLAAFDATTGKPLWNEKVAGEVRGLAISAGRLVATTQRGELFCFEHGGAAEPTVHHLASQSPGLSPRGPKKIAEDILERSKNRKATRW